MSIKTILNRCHPLRCLVYGAARFVGEQLQVEVRPRKGSRGQCGECGGRGPTYDTARQPRSFEFVPLWGLVVWFVYRMRRVNCPACGVTVERVPWCDGKHRLTTTYRWFLARWARRRAWSEVAGIFHTSWDSVCRSVEHAMEGVCRTAN